MIGSRTQSRSSYMEFAKLSSSAKYNLATSGMASFTMAELAVTIDQLEINPPVGYGYEPYTARSLRATAFRLNA